MNTYVCLQLQTGQHVSVQGAFTSCCTGDENPEWHESFRFDSDALDKHAYLIGTVVHVPGITKEEVEAAGYAIATEVGWVEGRFDRTSARGVQRAKQTLVQAAFGHMDNTVKKNNGLQANNYQPTTNQQVPQQPTGAPLSKKELKDAEAKHRRWDCLRVVQNTLRNHGVNVPSLPVPNLHIPLGVILVHFRSLREAVIGVKPVSINQPLRGCPGASLKIEIDFRPRMWRCNDLDQVDPNEVARFGTPRTEVDEQAAIDKVLKTGYRGPVGSKDPGFVRA